MTKVKSDPKAEQQPLALSPKKNYSVSVFKCLELSESVYLIQLVRPAKFTWKEGQCVGVKINDNLRLYSIASSQDSPTIDLCVKKIDNGKVSPILTSEFPPVNLEISGPFGDELCLKLTDNLSSLIFVAAGTGIAPVRAFFQKFRNSQSIQIHYFLGFRTRQDVLFKEDFNPDQIKSLHVAYSREEGKYVQDLLKEFTDYDLLAKSTIFICGSKPMGLGVVNLLKQILGEDLYRIKRSEKSIKIETY
jgi:NAD(P)H-flavin reductase